jgi:hypothetical protein
MRDPELVARARYAAARLEQAWERWRTLHGLGGVADPLASYVGYSLKEPMGQPRVVVGLDAAEAEYFADFLENHECGGRAQTEGPSANGTARQPAARGRAQTEGPSVNGTARQPAAPSAPAPRDASLELVARAVDSAERAGLGSAAPPAGAVAHAFHQAPVGNDRPQGPPQDAPDVIAAELAGWASGELPGQASEQLAAMASDTAASEAMNRPRPSASPVGAGGSAPGASLGESAYRQAGAR